MREPRFMHTVGLTTRGQAMKGLVAIAGLSCQETGCRWQAVNSGTFLLRTSWEGWQAAVSGTTLSGPERAPLASQDSKLAAKSKYAQSQRGRARGYSCQSR